MNLRDTASPWVASLAGLLPVLAANAAFTLNVGAGLEGCFPYWEGCMSVSRGARSGPGLLLFKALAMPGALAMALCWHQVGHWLRRVTGFSHARNRALVSLGITGAVFLIVYAAALGTEGEAYRWMRRYGVVFYFGLTGLAQLMLVGALWPARRRIGGGRAYRRILVFATLVVMTWMLGVASAFKRKLIDNPDFLDRVENALEWNFALALSLGFVALALVLGVRQKR